MANRSLRQEAGSRKQDNARVSLLANRSPPASPSPFGQQQQRQQQHDEPLFPDPNVVSSLYPMLDSTASFEQSNNKSRATLGRFAPQTGNSTRADREIPPQQGALQFVPAFEGSWDAEEKKESPATDIAQRSSLGVANNRAPRGVAAGIVTKQSSDSASTTVSGNSKRGNRIQRLASLFSSRAVVKPGTKQGLSPLSSRDKKAAAITKSPAVPQVQQQQKKGTFSPMSFVPPSPAHSVSSGSGYVGWPGTQDKRGATVAMPGSYDEGSSVGAPPAVVPSTAAAARKNNNNTMSKNNLPYEQELQEAAAREMNRWTGSKRASFDDFSSVGSFTPSPIAPLDPRNMDSGHFSSTSDRDAGAAATEQENAADYHLAAAVADAKAAASSPLIKNSLSAVRYAAAGHGSVAASEAVSFQDLFPGGSSQRMSPRHEDPWGDEDETSSRVNSAGCTDVSKTSSAYFDAKELSGLGYPDLDYKSYNDGRHQEETTAAAVAHRKRQQESSASSAGPRPPTEDALANNDRLQPPHRSFNAPGYRGLIDKTKEVPSLMDDMDSDSMASSKATTTYSASAPAQVRRGHGGGDNESDVFDDLSAKDSDVFDNLSNVDGRGGASPRKPAGKMHYPERIVEETESSGGQEDFKLVLLGGGLTAIQSTKSNFSERQTADDFDDNLTDSDIDQFGFAQIPGFSQMASAGKFSNKNSLEGIHGNLGASPRRDPYGRGAQRDDLIDSEPGSSLFSDPYGGGSQVDETDRDYLTDYYIQPSQMKKLVRKYRKLSELINTDLSLADFEKEEDEHKAFAMFEMRSRIMEKDIERGLERRGGTMAVDDVVTTPYNRTAQRIRDAVIVSKAWRDGASPRDVINTALLTRRADHDFFIKRPIHGNANDSGSAVGGYSISSQRYYWEAVKWVDDTDFMQYRCPSLGPRHLRGFEMFTIGDCQSILLKLTNERCMVRTASIGQ